MCVLCALLKLLLHSTVPYRTVPCCTRTAVAAARGCCGRRAVPCAEGWRWEGERVVGASWLLAAAVPAGAGVETGSVLQQQAAQHNKQQVKR